MRNNDGHDFISRGRKFSVGEREEVGNPALVPLRAASPRMKCSALVSMSGKWERSVLPSQVERMPVWTEWVRSTGLVVQKALEGILAEEPANRCYWDHWSIWFQGRDYRVMKGSQVMMLVCRMRPGRLSKSENPEPRGRIIEFFSRSGTCAFVILMSSSSAFWCKPSKLVNGGPGCRTPTGGATHLGDSAKGSGWSCAVPSLGTQAWPCDNQAPWKLPEMPLNPLLTEEGPWAPAVH